MKLDNMFMASLVGDIIRVRIVRESTNSFVQKPSNNILCYDGSHKEVVETVEYNFSYRNPNRSLKLSLSSRKPVETSYSYDVIESFGLYLLRISRIQPDECN